MNRHTTFRYCLDPTVEQQAVLTRHAGAVTGLAWRTDVCQQVFEEAAGSGTPKQEARSPTPTDRMALARTVVRVKPARTTWERTVRQHPLPELKTPEKGGADTASPTLCRHALR